jgi:hypothetical protein
MFKRTLTHPHRIMTAIKISVDLKVPFSETNRDVVFAISFSVFGDRGFAVRATTFSEKSQD